jgi:hypothetical protein
VNVWEDHTGTVAICIAVWSVAPIVGCLVLLTLENLKAVREAATYVYGLSPTKWPPYELQISCLLCAILSEFFGIFCLVYAISGVLSMQYLAEFIESVGVYSFVIYTGILVAVVGVTGVVVSRSIRQRPVVQYELI